MLKIGFYSPYSHILGGGEKYILTIAKLLKKNNKVSLFASPELKKKAEKVFGISLKGIDFISQAIFQKNFLQKKISLRQSFDIFFYMTDGSIFFPPCEKNYLIIQSPIHLPPDNFVNRLKLKNWQIICYSEFMSKIINGRLKKEAIILSPAINCQQLENNYLEKKDIILSVGRFFPYPHNKKHDELIRIFKKFYKHNFPGFKLIITGNLTEDKGKQIFSELKKKVGQLPIELYSNLDYPKLLRLYQQAKIYWHATGFQEDIKKYPERVEHFGITTLEAMAAGCVPIVFAAGGQKDIIKENDNGYLWRTDQQLIQKTLKLVKNPGFLEKMRKNAISSAWEYDEGRFYDKLEKIFH